MNDEDYEKFFELIKSKGTDFYSIMKYKDFQKYTLSDMEDGYIHIMEHIGFLCPNSGGCEDIKQIKDIYRIKGDIFFDVFVEDEKGDKVLKHEVFIRDYRSKFFTLLKDYKFFLKGKINMIREIEENFRKQFDTIEKDSSDV